MAPLKAKLLRTSRFLSDFSDEELERLAVAFQQEEFAPGTILFREGDPGDRFALVLRGEIEIIKALGTPDERLLAVVKTGGFLGEMGLLDPSGQRSASARARTVIEWAQITRADFLTLIQTHSNLALRLLKEMISRLRRSETETIRDLRAKNEALEQAYSDLQQAQSALVEKEKLEHELEIARGIQKSILPKQIPDLPGWQIAAHWQPARAVSGDFYDLLPFPEGNLGLLIADVSGKGVPAALVMATTCSTLRAVAGPEITPGAVLEQVNTILCRNIPGKMFVTCLYANLDPARRVIRFANAGHNLPIKRSGGGVEELQATGMPLGLLPGMIYEENEARLEPGDQLLFYTDGIVEAHNRQHEMFGMPRLRHCLAEAAGTRPTIEHLLARLAEFTGPDWEQEDDATFMVLTCAEEPLT